MASVTHIGGGRLPDMTVVEVAVVVALLRRGPSRIDALAPVLAEWFATPVAFSDLTPSVRRMFGRGWLAEARDGRLSPGLLALQPTQRLYAGFIRMLRPDLDLGHEFEPVRNDDQLSLAYDARKETEHDHP